MTIDGTATGTNSLVELKGSKELQTSQRKSIEAIHAKFGQLAELMSDETYIRLMSPITTHVAQREQSAFFLYSNSVRKAQTTRIHSIKVTKF